VYVRTAYSTQPATIVRNVKMTLRVIQQKRYHVHRKVKIWWCFICA